MDCPEACAQLIALAVPVSKPASASCSKKAWLWTGPQLKASININQQILEIMG